MFYFNELNYLPIREGVVGETVGFPTRYVLSVSYYQRHRWNSQS